MPLSQKAQPKSSKGLHALSRAPSRAARADKEPETGSVFGAILQKTILRDLDAGLIVVGIDGGLSEGAEGRRRAVRAQTAAHVLYARAHAPCPR